MAARHLAAILLFSGPIFYVGLLMAIHPASFARGIERVARAVRPDRLDIAPKIQTAVRWTGVALALLAIAA